MLPFNDVFNCIFYFIGIACINAYIVGYFCEFFFIPANLSWLFQFSSFCFDALKLSCDSYMLCGLIACGSTDITVSTCGLVAVHLILLPYNESRLISSRVLASCLISSQALIEYLILFCC